MLLKSTLTDKDYEVIKSSKCFENLSDEEIEKVIKCTNAVKKPYSKGETIMRDGDKVLNFGLVLSGSVMISKDDFWGNINILDKRGPGRLYAESFAFAGNALSDVFVYANEDTEILLLNANSILTTCERSCDYHNKLIRNMLSVVAMENLDMNEKISHVTQRTTRQKLLSYLTSVYKHTGKCTFDIPYNRQELADYLSVDRSAMSSELGRLKREGLIDYSKNHFQLKKKALKEVYI
ncbi:MAG: Crp/Fnr family transcriptional regulator [Lachnospiraceae bacterium]|jgi:CRP-like cAMP-binding protein|nr:Crp/Fnr family transcriptional regulator [Lachnospiraceae bacterium]MEE3461243.1 Crp/Fnr family transcriptional regulator [Lachnospiraceae bacterium]